MARGLNLLSARRVAALNEAGRHAHGGGLYLRITQAGSRSWVFMTTSAGKRQEIGLGPANALPLAAARDLASRMCEAISLRLQPRTVLDDLRHVEAATPTFGAFAESYISSVEEGWKNPVHRQQWRSSLRDHAGSLEKLPIDQVTTDHVLDVLKPIWLSKSETARRCGAVSSASSTRRRSAYGGLGMP